MNKTTQNIIYRISLTLICAVSLLPMRVLYVLSDLLYYVLYHLVGYRRKMVSTNLVKSFPDKSKQELHSIERQFYHWFCDYIFETLKLFTISESEIRRRMKFEGTEALDEAVYNGKCITVFLGHYGNWEWVSTLGLHITNDAQPAQIYHHLESPVMDRILLYARARFGSVNLEMKESFAKLRAMQRQGIRHVTGYISDQAPGFDGSHYWTTFLNHPKTPCYSGGERIARLLGTPCFYIDIRRPRRGRYVAHFVKICDDPADLPRFGITARYFELLEQSIRINPYLWLWSHNRWKRTWEQFLQAYPDEEARNKMLNKL